MARLPDLHDSQAPRSRRDDAVGERPELLRALHERGCPVCGQIAAASGYWLQWFVVETYAAPQMLSRLAASAGLCAWHVRSLLRHAGEPVLVSTLMESVAGARRILTASGQPQLAECPACADLEKARRRALDGLIRHLGAADVRRSLAAGDGLCVPHTRQALPDSRPPAGRFLAARLGAQLSDDRGQDPSTVAGSDSDVVHRSLFRRVAEADALAAEEADIAEPAETALLRELVVARCPLCHAASRAAWRYLGWLAADPADARDEDRRLCPTHLHDLVAIDGATGRTALAATTRYWRAGLTRFLEQAAGGTSRWPTRRRAYDEAIAAVTAPPRCRACVAAAIADRRLAELLTAALPVRAVARAYADSHGLCVRHALAWRHDPSRSAVWQVLAARLAVIAWELDEWQRKRGWSARHEASGPVLPAWQRACTLLDGEICAGLDARSAAAVIGRRP